MENTELENTELSKWEYIFYKTPCLMLSVLFCLMILVLLTAHGVF